MDEREHVLLEKLYPTKENDSAFTIPYESLYALGKRGIIMI